MAKVEIVDKHGLPLYPPDVTPEEIEEIAAIREAAAEARAMMVALDLAAEAKALAEIRDLYREVDQGHLPLDVCRVAAGGLLQLDLETVYDTSLWDLIAMTRGRFPRFSERLSEIAEDPGWLRESYDVLTGSLTQPRASSSEAAFLDNTIALMEGVVRAEPHREAAVRLLRDCRLWKVALRERGAVPVIDAKTGRPRFSRG